MLRGLVACGFGPMVLAVVYLFFKRYAHIDSLTVDQACIGIFSLTALAFMAGGMNAIYRIERLPLMVAILIHGGVLYVFYLVTYLVNDWLAMGLTPVLVFTAIFAVGYLLIWAIVYCITKRSAKQINALINKSLQKADISGQ